MCIYILIGFNCVLLQHERLIIRDYQVLYKSIVNIVGTDSYVKN